MRLRILSIAALTLLMTASATAEKAGVSVLPFVNKTSTSDNLASALSTMMTTALERHCKRFNLVNRENLGDIFDEQSLGASGAVDSRTAARIGELTGADYILFGTITEAGASESGFGLPGGGFKIRNNRVVIAVDVHFVDSTTGEVVFAETFRDEEKTSDVGYLNMEFDGDESTVGEAGRRIIDSIARKCMLTVNPPEVIRVDGTTVYTDCGDAVFSVGDIWEIVVEGEELRNSAGDVLGHVPIRTGEVLVTTVDSQFSVGQVRSGTVNVGSRMQPMSTMVASVDSGDSKKSKDSGRWSRFKRKIKRDKSPDTAPPESETATE